jgi:hypothetical protein
MLRLPIVRPHLLTPRATILSARPEAAVAASSLPLRSALQGSPALPWMDGADFRIRLRREEREDVVGCLCCLHLRKKIIGAAFRSLEMPRDALVRCELSIGVARGDADPLNVPALRNEKSPDQRRNCAAAMIAL